MITTDQSKEINRIRLREQARERATEYQSQLEAERINSWNRFKFTHAGSKAVANKSVYFDCEANDRAMEAFLKKEELPITFDTLTYAFESLTKVGSLAQFPKQQQYERKTNVSESRIAPQTRTFAPAERVAPYTKSALLEMSRSEFRQAVKIYGIRELNRILQGR